MKLPSDIEDWEKPRSRSVHLTAAEIQFIKDSFIARRTVREVARELKCSMRTVVKYYGFFRAEGQPGKPRRKVKILQPWERQAILDAYRNGEKLEAVAAEFGCTIYAVSRAGRRAGLPPRRYRHRTAAIMPRNGTKP